MQFFVFWCTVLSYVAACCPVMCAVLMRAVRTDAACSVVCVLVMRPIGTDAVCSVVCVLVTRCTLQKRLNRKRTGPGADSSWLKEQCIRWVSRS